MVAMTVFQHKAVMVKNLRPGLTEVGKIKIGQKGRVIQSRNGNEFQPPQKLDHFVITTLHRGADDNFLRDDGIHKRLGDKPTEIPVRLLFNDPWMNFRTQYVAFWGKTRFCTGDGETAQRLQKDGTLRELACPCERLDPGFDQNGKCKINGTLSVIIDGAEVVGGVWNLRTTSINTCQGIASSLAMLATVTSGNIAGVPLMLTIRPKAAQTPDGKATTIYVVGLEFRGSIEDLRGHAEKRALADATFGRRMLQIEEMASVALDAPIVSDEEAIDVIQEFYPEEAVRVVAASNEAIAAEKKDEPIDASPAGGMIEVVDANGEIFLKPPVEVEAFLREQIPLLAADFIDEWRQMNADSLGEELLGLLAEHERAEQVKSAKGSERAGVVEGTVASERAVHDERTETDERAGAAEGNGVSEPAVKQERTAEAERADTRASTKTPERAADVERTEPKERAEAPESTRSVERAASVESAVQAEPPKPAADEEVIVLWPGEQDPARMKWASFPPAYMRRKRSGHSGWAEEFKRLNPDLYERLPASNR